MKSERLVELFGDPVAHPEGPEGERLQLLVLELLGEDELLGEHLEGLVHVGHLDEDVAHVAQGPESILVLLGRLGQG